MFDSTLPFFTQSRTLTIDSEISTYNIYSQLGQPTYPVVILLRILDSGVVTSLSTGDLNVESVVRITNRGYILGRGGLGGRGANVENEVTPSLQLLPGNGGEGGAALFTRCKLEIDCTEGFILGGGGGGGGDSILSGDPFASQFGGSGSGGVSGGGANFGIPQGEPATSGINAVPGTVNAAGGDWGEPGQPGRPGGIYGTGSGGAAGKAIITNGNSVTFFNTTLADLQVQNRIKGDIV